MTTGMGRVLRAAVAAVAVAGLLTGWPASAAPSGHTYKAPFKLGPSGGDQFSYHNASTDGTVTVGRIYPIPGAINCVKGAPYAKLQVPITATRQVRKIVASYDSSAIDNFTFAMVALRDKAANRWYGTTTDRGFVSGSGTITLKPDHQQVEFPRKLIVEFGLQQSSACPNADAGSMHFTSIQVFS